MIKLLVIDRVQKMKGNLVFDQDEIIFGRGKDCDIVLGGDGISRQHSKIKKELGRYFVTDLKSTNGTAIENKQIQPDEFIKLSHEDKFFVGKNVEVTIYLEEEKKIDESKHNITQIGKTIIRNIIPEFLTRQRKRPTAEELESDNSEVTHMSEDLPPRKDQSEPKIVRNEIDNKSNQGISQIELESLCGPKKKFKETDDSIQSAGLRLDFTEIERQKKEAKSLLKKDNSHLIDFTKDEDSIKKPPQLGEKGDILKEIIRRPGVDHDLDGVKKKNTNMQGNYGHQFKSFDEPQGKPEPQKVLLEIMLFIILLIYYFSFMGKTLKEVF